MYHLLMPSLYTLNWTCFVIVLENIISLKKREKLYPLYFYRSYTPYIYKSNKKLSFKTVTVTLGKIPPFRNLQILLGYILANNIFLYFILFFAFFQLVNYLNIMDIKIINGFYFRMIQMPFLITLTNEDISFRPKSCIDSFNYSFK